MVVIRKMKEKCKDAARMRREKERVEFVELAKLLPLPASTTSQLDKASIIRLTSSYLRMRSAFPQGLGENWGTKRRLTGGHATTSADLITCNDQNQLAAQQQHVSINQLPAQIKELGSLLLQTLDGFVFALNRDGKIMYISETASVHLGLPQIDLTGSSVFDYIHPADHGDLMGVLSLSETERLELDDQLSGCPQSYQRLEETVELGRSFCMRMKCILPKRNAGLVSNGFKAIHCSGYLKVRCKQVNSLSQKSQVEGRSQGEPRPLESYALVAVGHSLLPTASTEIKLSMRTFMFRANLDLRLYYIEAPISNLLGFQQSELVGRSLYQFVHVADLGHLESAHRQVLDKGQVVSRYHRLMRRDGGYIWVQAHATLVNNPRSMPKPQHIVGICCLIGESNQLDNSCLIVLEEPNLNKIHEPAQMIEPIKQVDEDLKALNHMKLLPLKSGMSKIASIKQSSKHGHKRNRNAKQILPVHQADRTKLFRSQQVVKQQIGDQRLNGSESAFDSENHPSRVSYSSIGSTRRPSDDTCSMVSSIASTTSCSSTSGYSHTTPGLTIDSTASSSPNEMPLLVTNQYLSKPKNNLYTVEDHPQYHYDPSPQTLGSHPNDQYSQRIINYEPQEYWSMPVALYDQAGAPISVDISCNQVSSCWPAMATTSISPSSLTTSTIATSQVSCDGSPTNGYTMSPEHHYVGEQYYYQLDEHPIQGYGQTGCNRNYSEQANVRLNYTKVDGPRPCDYDQNLAQSYTYYAPHQATA